MKSINPKQTTEDIISFLKSSFYAAKFQNTVIAVSGGVDSATSLTLTVKALGKDHVYPLLLPYGKLNQQGVVDGRLIIDALGIPQRNVQEVDIQPMVDSFLRHPELAVPLEVLRSGVSGSSLQIRKGNIMARVRMIVLFDQAKKRNALVVGTENKTEHYLGYYTRFGDEASDIEPLRGLYKTQVYGLARYLDIPESILTKVPTAGLWVGQTDEGEFGFTYKEADEILQLYIDEKLNQIQIEEKIGKREVVKKVLDQVEKNAYKHNLPIIFL